MAAMKTLSRFEAQEMAARGIKTPPAVEFRHVTKRFDLQDGGSHIAVDDISLQMAPGEFLCVLGPSGHGKTTMLNLLAGFIEPTSGEIRLAGNPV